MRPGQNNKRMRGNRPTNNRRGPNPLTRSYESNGPDVKIRGNAHHVAEKYLQLARDAHTSGDPVAAENYLQHAEHYFRLIASAQAAQLAAQQGRPPGEDDDDGDDDDGGVLDRFASPAERAPAYPPPTQPYGQPQGQFYNNEQQQRPPQPFEGGGEQQPPRPQHNGGERNNFQPRGDRPQHNNNRDNRGPRPQYNNDRQDGGQRDFRNGGDNRPPREFRPYREPTPPPPQEALQPQPRLDIPQPELPAFITAAPRPIAPVEALNAPQPSIEPAVAEAAAPDVAGPEGETAPRGRRRRLRSPYGFQAGVDEAPAPVAPGDLPPSD